MKLLVQLLLLLLSTYGYILIDYILIGSIVKFHRINAKIDEDRNYHNICRFFISQSPKGFDTFLMISSVYLIFHKCPNSYE